MTAKTEPCDCDERQCTGVKVVSPRAQEAYQPQLFAGSDVEVLDSNSWCSPEGGPGVFGLVHVRAFFRALADFYGDEIPTADAIDLDPATNRQSTVGAVVEYTLADDGLASTWDIAHGRPTRIWLNNPYDKPRPWMRRCHESYAAGFAEILALPKGDWSTSWWQDYVRPAPARCELSKRMAFVSKGKRSVANFPSVLVYWGRRPDLFSLHFYDFGEVIFGRVPPGSEEPSADLPGWAP